MVMYRGKISLSTHLGRIPILKVALCVFLYLVGSGVRGKVLEWRGGGQHWRSAWEGAGVERGRAALAECGGRC